MGEHVRPLPRREMVAIEQGVMRKLLQNRDRVFGNHTNIYHESGFAAPDYRNLTQAELEEKQKASQKPHKVDLDKLWEDFAPSTPSSLSSQGHTPTPESETNGI